MKINKALFKRLKALPALLLVFALLFTTMPVIGFASNTGETIYYTANEGKEIALDDEDFNDVCINETGSRLYYVKFTLPSSVYGTLYYRYNTAYEDRVTSSSSFYYNSTLSRVSFVPADGYTGTFTISYSGYSENDDYINGKIRITIGDAGSDADVEDIFYTTDKNKAVKFRLADFEDVCEDATGKQLYFVKFSLPPASCGKLCYKYNTSSQENVSSSVKYYADSTLSNITFVPNSSYSGPAEIFYSGCTKDSQIFTGYVRVGVGNYNDGSDVDIIKYNIDENEALKLSAPDFNSVCKSQTGAQLDYVKFTLPSSSYGTLYYNYISPNDYEARASASQKYYYNEAQYLKRITFVPKSGYNGTAVVSYRAYSIDGDYFDGQIKITVGDENPGDVGLVKYTADQDKALAFYGGDFNSICEKETSSSLDYIKFTLPLSSHGTLYYNYSSASNYGSKTTSGDKYYYGSTLSKVVFVPKSGYSGAVLIKYTGVNDDGDDYIGYIKITVGDAAASAADIKYKTDINEKIAFDREDFDDACETQTGEPLNYVKFTLPSSSYGTLYYNYKSALDYGSKVTASDKYYYDSTLSKVVFVPKGGYSGTVLIKYAGVNDDGDDFSGYIKINVGKGVEGDVDNIEYFADIGEEASFYGRDFNLVCENGLYDTLDYVNFTLPSANYGILYYDYDSSANYNSTVMSSYKYYYTGKTPSLSKVTFMPRAGYSGMVNILYTGYDQSGDKYSGYVTVSVDADGNAQDKNFSYSINSSAKIEFDQEDFNNLCIDATGETLNYINFTPPSSSRGTLYYNYNADSGYGSSVEADTNYYVAAYPYLSKLTFIPNSKYSGTFNIAYTGHSVRGDVFSGTIKITVNSTQNNYFKDIDSDLSWALPAINFLYERDIIKGVDENIYAPRNSVKRGDFMLLIYRAFGLSTASASDNFPDVNKNDYYYSAIASAKSLGIAQGYKNMFNPQSPITRQDAMVLLKRTLDVKKIELKAKNSDSITSFNDYKDIKDYAEQAIDTFVKAGIINGSNSNLSPTYNITRAEMAVILHRILES